MTTDDLYRPPAVERAANHSTFAPDEWRYMAKVFAAWFLGGSLLIAFVGTWQFGMVLSQFGAEEYLGRVVMLEVLGRSGASLVMVAACNTLVMVTHRRAKAAILEPVQKPPWWIPGCLGLATPIAMAVMLGSSLVITTYWVGVPWAASWKGLQAGMRWIDFASSILSVTVVAALLVALVPQTMRLFLRLRGWLLLEIIIASQVIGSVTYLIHSAWNAVLST